MTSHCIREGNDNTGDNSHIWFFSWYLFHCCSLLKIRKEKYMQAASRIHTGMHKPKFYFKSYLFTLKLTYIKICRPLWFKNQLDRLRGCDVIVCTVVKSSRVYMWYCVPLLHMEGKWEEGRLYGCNSDRCKGGRSLNFQWLNNWLAVWEHYIKTEPTPI